MKKYLTLALTLLLIFQSVFVMPFGLSHAVTNNPSRYDQPKWFETDPLSGQTWSEYITAYGLPIETKRLNEDGYAFSMEHWIDKRIVVYGGPDDVPANDFKNSTLVGTVVTPNQGYYENGTGEYRYHGFDAVGNPYNNNNFPKDLDSGSQPSSKNWIYHIWDKNSPYHYSPSGTARIASVSDYNKTAIEDSNTDIVVYTRNYIENGLPFKIERSTNSNKSPYNYAHVLTRPTSLFPGEAVLWHDPNNYANPSGKLMWNQTFSLNKIEEKAPTPVTAQIEITSISDKAIDSSGAVVVKGIIHGKLQDDYMYDGINEEGIPDDVYRGAFYNREDISSWSFKIRDQVTGQEKTLTGIRETANTGSAEFTISIPYSAYKHLVSLDDPSLEIILDGSSTSHFNTGDSETGYASTDGSVSGGSGQPAQAPPINVEAPIFEEMIPPMNFDVTAPDKMLDTERFNLRDNTVPLEGAIREIYIGGQLLSESQEEAFASGQHLFPLTGEDKIYNYKIKYIDPDGTEYEYISHIVVYTTKPKAQFKVTGTFKENRLIEANTDITSVNSSYLISNATIGTDFFNTQNLDGSSTIIKYGTQNASKLAYIVKDQASIQMNMRVTTSVPGSKIHRSDIPSGYFTSDVYKYNLFVLEDYAPALISNVWNATLVRNEVLDFYYDSASVDQDNISVSTYKIYYDNDGNGTPELLIKQGNYADYTEFKPTQLGNYKIVFYAEEKFGQPTLSQFITTADKKTATLEREFYVDNLAPMTKIYTDIEYDFPESDVVILNDQAITRDLNNTIVSERVNWINSLRQSGISTNMETWDLHTYVYSQSASTSRNTGGSYPSSTRSYSSDGYSGTLSLYNVVNNEYRQDDGRYVTTTDSKTVSTSKSQSGTAPPTTASNIPSTVSYSSGGYTGTMYQDSYDYSTSPVYEADGSISTWKYKWRRYATYSGTATKTSTVWQSDYNWYDDYRGYYSGTIYKNVKQTFTPTFRNGSDKYVVYFADSTINNKTDLQSVLNKGDAKVILVSKSTAKSQVSHSYWVDSTQSLENIMKAVNEIVKENNPVDNRKLLLVGETFTTNVANFDMEGDPLSVVGFQYLQDANYYDNSMGVETGTRTSYLATAFSGTVKSYFSKVGKYTVHRMIKDTPIGKASFGKESNVPQLDVYVHRKPIADFTLDWDYNTSDQKYKTTWVDLSYDLDHQFSDAQKGIRDRQIMYRKTDGDNQWIYTIPDNLAYGVYEVSYIVKDIEGAWSNPKTKLFTLDAIPELIIDAELEPPVLPASETLSIKEIFTQYHEAHDVKLEWLTQSGQYKGAIALLLYSNMSNYNKIDSKHHWLDQGFKIPDATQDGNYIIRVSSRDVSVNLPFKVLTPIDVVGSMDEMVAGEKTDFYAEAGRYASSVTVSLYIGTVHEVVRNMIYVGRTGSGRTLWKYSETIPESIEEGFHDFRFTARTPSGNQATHDVSAKIEVLRILEVGVKGYWNHWRGQVNLFGELMTNEPHRFLSHEKVIVTVRTVGNPEIATVRWSSELEQMLYTDAVGHTHSYEDAFGFIVDFPLALNQLSTDLWEVEYILPLANHTLSWDNSRTAPPYFMEIEVKKGTVVKKSRLEDIDITGNIYDLLYLQPRYDQ